MQRIAAGDSHLTAQNSRRGLPAVVPSLYFVEETVGELDVLAGRSQTWGRV